jgi:3-hydroxyisobutyrate dehydrogenase-like beta-hydroxyacid dehydrogenase
VGSIKVGFIGLGNMGIRMAKSLAKEGFPLTVYDIRQEPIEEMKALGAAGASSSREVAEASDVIISMVWDVPQTEEVILVRTGCGMVSKRFDHYYLEQYWPGILPEAICQSKEQGIK